MPPLAQAAARPPRGVPGQAQQLINPMIAALTRAANLRAQRADQAITGYTNSYANQLGQINAASPYANAETKQAAVDASLRGSLTGAGTDLASQLASRLSQLDGTSGASALHAASGSLASQGAAAGGTQVASGSAALSSLLANEAGAGSYDAKLPGLAKLSGLQGIKQAQLAAQSTINQGTLSAESQLPSIARDINAQNSANAYRRAQIGQGNARLSIEQQNANTSGERTALYSQHLQQTYGLDLAKMQMAQQKAIEVRASGGLSPNEVASMRQKAASALHTYYDGVAAKYEIGVNGQRIVVSGTGPGSQKTYQNAIRSILLSYSALGPKQVINMANQLYAPGEGGRPKGPPPPYYTSGPLKGLPRYMMGPIGHPTGAASRGASGIARYAGTDQGVDFTSTGAIPALGHAVVTGVGPETDIEGQHGSYVIYKLLSGPNRGRYVYTAENFAPMVEVGDRLLPGQTIGLNRGIDQNGTGIEIGFNQTGNSWYPVAQLGRGEAAHGPTGAGQQMWQYIQAVLRELNGARR